MKDDVNYSNRLRRMEFSASVAIMEEQISMKEYFDRLRVKSISRQEKGPL